jgi:hypothetical protein
VLELATAQYNLRANRVQTLAGRPQA